MKKLACVLLITALSSTALSSIVFAKNKTGHFTVRFTKIFATQDNGSRDFSFKNNLQCISSYHKFLFKTMRVDYTINPKNLFETVTATFEGNKVILNSEGTSDRYRFISDGTGSLQLQGINRVMASLNHAYGDGQGALLADGKTKNYYCVLTSNRFK